MKQTFKRWSKKLDKYVDVLGKETDIRSCIVCKQIKNQKFFHLCMKDNFNNYRVRTTCENCYNEDRKLRRNMDLLYEKPECCEICNKEKDLFPDHSHITSKHRGWLCRECNTAIGQLGDTIKDERGREGAITNIGIATDKIDIAAEADTSLSAKEYDTDLNYVGAVTFGGNWCYFNQIEDNLTEKEKSDVDVAIEQENEWWK